MSKPFAKLDELYDDNRKVKRAWRRDRATVGLHAMAITYCKRHRTDGLVDLEWIEDRLPDREERERVVAVLLDLDLLEVVDEETFRVHDFLDWQMSTAERERRAEQARSAAHAKWDAVRMQNAERDACEPHSDTDSGSDAKSDADRYAEEEVEEEERTTSSSDVDVRRLDEAKTVLQLVDYWRHRCGHPQAKATDERKQKVRARLREGYTADQVRAGIDGAAVAAFVNEDGHRFDDLTLICRTGSKLEDFIRRGEAASREPVQPGPREPDPMDGLGDVA